MLLVDDQELIRTALSMVMADLAKVEVAGEAASGEEAVRLSTEHTWMIVLTTFDDDSYVYGALRAGASGFLVKDRALEDTIAAVRVVAAGDALIAPSVTRRLIHDLAMTKRQAGAASRRASPTGNARC